MTNSLIAAAVLISATGVLADCPPSDSEFAVPTERYWLEAQGLDGAVGDVIPVNILLHSQLPNSGFIAMDVAVCHESDMLEIVGEPVYSDEFTSLIGIGGVFFLPVDQGSSVGHTGHGFFLPSDVDETRYNARFPSEVPLPVMTVYYRIKGQPGSQTNLTFCDGQLVRQPLSCIYNRLHIFTPENHGGWAYLSTRNVGTTITVLDGPPTRPDRPPEPPKARIYEERLTVEQVNFQVHIDGTFAAPGSKSVPIDVKVSADVEYSGIEIPVDFDERYLWLSRVESGLVSGSAVVNNQNDTQGADAHEGYVVIFSGYTSSTRRLAAEGEAITAATLYFNVLESAAAVESTTLSVNAVGTAQALYPAWVGVSHRDGVGVESPVVRSEIGPILTRSGVLKLRAPPLVLRGDANFDGDIDISDPVAILNYLFQNGEDLSCANAADFTFDGNLDISDPIALLRLLFSGYPIPGGSDSPRVVRCE